MSAKIEAVIFDLGQVIININLRPLLKQVSPTGDLKEGHALLNKIRSDGIVPKLNAGKITLKTFHKKLRSKYNLHADYKTFKEAWCSIFSPRPDMEALVKKLAGKIPLGLLSDTDPVHWEYIRQHYPVVELFEKPVLSFEVEVVKPDPAIYMAAAESVGALPNQCFYTDDLHKNVEGAWAVGMTAVHFQDADQIRRELKNAGIL